MSGVEVRPVRGWQGRRVFVDVPFRVHGGDPGWVPPLRLSVHDRISPRHPANAHQEVALWVAYRHGGPVGRIGACVDRAFDRFQGVRWGWIGFYSSFDDAQVATALFDTATAWCRSRGATTAVGPADFTTNDELGLQVDGFDEPPAILTLQNPPYYQALWEGGGWDPLEDLWAWHFDKTTTALSERQRRVLGRIKGRAGLRVRSLDMGDFDAEVGRFFDLYNAAWSHNLAFAPMAEAEIRHLAKQLKSVLNPTWAFGVEDAGGTLVGVCLALPDLNQVMVKVRNGRLWPLGGLRLLAGRRRVTNARVWALGIRPDYQNLAVGPLLYQEIVDRLAADPYIATAEGGWTLASNHRINDQLEAMGARRSKTWRLYQRQL